MKFKDIFGGGSAPEEEIVTEEETLSVADAAMAEFETDPAGAVAKLTAALRQAEAERERRERELRVLGLLSERMLPASLCSMIMGAEGDAAELVDELSRVISAAAERAVLERCRTKAPETGRGGALTSEEILRTPVAELARNMGFRR